MTADNLSQRVSELSERLEELKIKCLSDPANAPEVLADALESLQASLKELSATDKELMHFRSELQASESILRAFFDSPGMLRGVVELEEDDLRYILVNQAVADVLGLMPDVVAGKLISELGVPPEIVRDYVNGCKESCRLGLPVSLETHRQFPNGYRWFHVTISYQGAGPTGRPRFAYVILDITERKLAEEALRESEKKYRTFIETANEGIWIIDAEARTTYVNEKIAKMLGFEPEEIIGKCSFDFMDEENRAASELRLKERKRGIKSNPEVKYIRKDGTPLWTISSITPLVDEAGNFAGALGMVTDITERKKVEEELKEKERIYSSIFDNTLDGFQLVELIYDERKKVVDFKFLRVNSTYESQTGQREDFVVGKTAKQFNPHIEKYWLDYYGEVDQTGKALHLQSYSQGTKRWYDVYTYSFSKGKVGSLFRDITDQKKIEKELRDAKEAAESAVEAKAAFLANMSHELRTPLNAVIGFSNLLLDDNLTQDQREYIERIRNGGEILLALISDILEFSRAEKEKITLEHQPLSLKHSIEESMGMVAAQAINKGLNLAYTVSYGTPDTIIGDPGRLRQILANLLSNAVKFTDDGDISVSFSSKVIEGNRRQITFSVKDTGIGMPQDKMDRLFQPFGQLEYTISRKRDGAGLGLAISKKLVELMGGEIWAESEEGKGSTFRFTIQAEAIPGKQLDLGEKDKAAVYENLAAQKPLSILVAEDSPSNQRVLVEMLKRLGYRADAVADGVEVLQALQNRPYDLIFMDIKMPEMDGLTATREIRKLWPENGPKVVAITAFAMDGDQEKCLEAGMDGYIAKPVKVDDLATLIRNITPPPKNKI